MIAQLDAKPELDKYELLEELGHGGMATVYRARDNRLGRDVALKIIHRHLRENREVSARFASEARAVAKVKHPNIVEVYDVSDDAEPERYLVVELVQGITLRKLLAEHGPMPAEIAACIGLQIARGLGHAHRQGVVHRDVKPENVLIELPSALEQSGAKSHPLPKLRVKITDFGIAKLLDAQGVTSTGQVLGSPAHMAPEQIEGGNVGAPSDVFGLGVLLYEATVGKLPFEGKNPAQVLRRVLDGSFTPPEKARRTLGQALGRIIERALAHRPEDRYPSAEELARALEQELERLGFEQPEAELEQYLRDPKGFASAYETRIVGRLVSLAHAARNQGDVMLASAEFNRALAFRPNDPELLKQVAGLARTEKRNRLLVRFLRAALVAGVVLLSGYALSRAIQQLDPSDAKAIAGQGSADKKPLGTLAKTGTGSAADEHTKRARNARARGEKPTERERAEKDASEPQSVVGAAAEPLRPARPSRAVPKAPSTRPVRILLEGPQNASVLIDGVERKQWFTKLYELALGPHSFEFIPPNSDCCEGKVSLTVEIVEGDGPQLVRGKIAFRPAILQLNGPTGTEATCGKFGVFSGPSSKAVPMDQATLIGQCTVIPPPESGAQPKEIDVTLSPGRTFAINWP